MGNEDTKQKWLKYFKIVMLFGACFDFITGSIGLFFPDFVVSMGGLAQATNPGAMYKTGLIEPVFIRGVGILWLWASYIQFVAWKDPVKNTMAALFAFIFRILGALLELVEIFYLLPRVGFEGSSMYVILMGFAVGDLLLVAIRV